MSVVTKVGEWMICVPGTPGTPMQHWVPDTAPTRPYALSHAYVAPCIGRPLCIPADEKYRKGVPVCPACARSGGR